MNGSKVCSFMGGWGVLGVQFDLLIPPHYITSIIARLFMHSSHQHACQFSCHHQGCPLHCTFNFPNPFQQPLSFCWNSYQKVLNILYFPGSRPHYHTAPISLPLLCEQGCCSVARRVFRYSDQRTLSRMDYSWIYWMLSHVQSITSYPTSDCCSSHCSTRSQSFFHLSFFEQPPTFYLPSSQLATVP